MRRLIIVLTILFVFNASAYAQMGMMGGQQGHMGHGMMMGQGAMMQDMMQMMMDMMNMQEKMMMGATATEKKQMMKNMSQMKEKMQQMMSMHMIMMMRQASDKMKCAEQWLKKAIDLHEIHIKDPKTATEASQMEMMEQMENAYKCITTGLETTETPAKVHEGEKTKREDSPKTEQHEHLH